jgi:hypothetical protein
MVDVRPERVHVQWLQPDWLRWIALGKGAAPLWSTHGSLGRTLVSVSTGRLAANRVAERFHMSGSLAPGRQAPRAPLERWRGAPRCGQCEDSVTSRDFSVSKDRRYARPRRAARSAPSPPSDRSWSTRAQGSARLQPGSVRKSSRTYRSASWL